MVKEASNRLYSSIKKDIEDIEFISRRFFDSGAFKIDYCYPKNPNHSHTRAFTNFLDWLFDGIEKGSIEIVENKAK